MIAIIPHPLELVHPQMAQECSLCHHSQPQVLAHSCLNVWTLDFRIPTMKVSRAPQSEAYV